ncbi:MAG: metal ABC transporter permease [Lentisphaeria bacterium]
MTMFFRKTRKSHVFSQNPEEPYLVVVPTAALGVSRRLSVVLVLSTLLGIIATLTGFTWSYRHDLPCNPCIIIAACLFSAIIAAAAWTWQRCRRLANKAT